MALISAVSLADHVIYLALSTWAAGWQWLAATAQTQENCAPLPPSLYSEYLEVRDLPCPTGGCSLSSALPVG